MFTYAGAPRGQDYEAWREVFCRRFCQLDVSPVDTGRIETTVEVSRVRNLSFGIAHGASGGFMRTRPLLSDGCDDLVLVTAVQGDALAVQRGRAMELRPTQMCLISLADTGESRFSDGGRYNALRIPRRDLAAVCRNVEDKLLQPFEGDGELRDVITNYFALGARTGRFLDPLGQQTMARHMTELVGLLLRSGASRAGWAQRENRQHRPGCGVRRPVLLQPPIPPAL